MMLFFTQFATFLLILFILELAGGIAAYVLRNDLKEMVNDKMTSSVDQYYNNRNVKDAWDIIQSDVSVRLICPHKFLSIAW